ncbi:MAG: hypothetical protein RLZZ46_1453 [Bacteroidota bacterium]
MAPMTRCRAVGNLPNSWITEYYSQRSGSGLIITEGTAPAAEGLGYARMPGLFNDEQQHAWAQVCESVHYHKGKIFLQIMHNGRIAAKSNLPPGERIIAPSAIKAPGTIFTDHQGLVEHDIPEEMSLTDIKQVISSYADCARRAIHAGFDGVEIHAASGYLPNQFLSDNVNQRSDSYGGSIENRLRFVLEILHAVTSVTGPFRTGIKISPGMIYNDIIIHDNISVYKNLILQLNHFPLAYLHVMRVKENGGEEIYTSCRKWYQGTLMLGGGFDYKGAQLALEEAAADLIAIGTAFIANPDLDIRWKNHYPLAQADRKRYYTPGPQGFIDYPNYSTT